MLVLMFGPPTVTLASASLSAWLIYRLNVAQPKATTKKRPTNVERARRADRHIQV